MKISLQEFNEHCRIAFSKTTIAIALAVFLALFAVPSLRAQVGGTGTVAGTVTDVSGAVVQAALVTLRNTATGYTVSQKTSGAGSYSLAAVPPGDYDVEVRADGFEVSLEKHVVVNALSQIGVNVTVKIGSSQEVVVSSNSVQLQTENGTTETTIPYETYSALPLAMSGGPKSVIGFMSLVPGVSQGGQIFGGSPVVNGGIQEATIVYLNGLPLATPELQGGSASVPFFSTENVEQFQVITSGVPSNYDGQGLANLVYKSGTNRFHGSVYENIRNTAFDAAGYFSRTGAPIEHQNEFGATVGGPILKDRIFFYGSYGGYRITSGSNPQFVTLPTLAMRQGDFSAIPGQIYDPATTTTDINGNVTRQPFANNQVPIRSSVASSFQSYLPPPQNDNISNNYFNTYTNGSKIDAYLAKVDATPFKNNHASFLFQRGKTSPLSFGSILPVPYTSVRIGEATFYIGQISDTQIITPRLLNVFGAQLIRTADITSNVTAKGNYPETAGFTGLPVNGEATHAFPPISFSGPNSPTAWAQGGTSFAEVPTSETFQDNVQWVKGKHSFTFGGQIILQFEALTEPGHVGHLSFLNTETAGFSNGAINEDTGNAYASFLLGLVDNGAVVDSAVTTTGGRWRNYAAYAQDDWKVSPKLTVNLGLRYTIPKPFVEQHDRTSWFNPNIANPVVDGALGILQFAGNGTDSCHCRTNVKTHYLTFGPRIGFAYAANSKSVIRSSFAIVHYNGGLLSGNGEQTGSGTLGYDASPNFATLDGGITPAFTLNGGFPAYQHPPFFDAGLNSGFTTEIPSGSGIAYNRPATAGRSPYTEEWNLNLERQLPFSMILSLSYAGTSSHFNGVAGGSGIYSDQVDPKYLVLGDLLRAPANGNTIAQAQAVFPEIKLPYVNFLGSIGQMLRPFPQYNGSGTSFEGMDPFANLGTTSYNAFQATLTKHMSNGLYLLAGYTLSKTMDEGGQTVQFAGPAPRSAYRLGAERTISSIDTPHQFSFTELYVLPFGKGQRFGGKNALVDGVLGNWQFSGIEQYASGTPLNTIMGNCNIPPYFGGGGLADVPPYNGNPSCYADYNTSFTGNPRINGKIGKGTPGVTPYLNVNAFTSAADYTFGTTPRQLAYASLRNEWSSNETVSLMKTFPIKDSVVFQFKADAFNVFNRTQFGGIDTTITDPSFGQISTQVNTPRQLQFEGYIRF
jgi:hypothetical protein